jgi:hypothetical protein
MQRFPEHLWSIPVVDGGDLLCGSSVPRAQRFASFAMAPGSRSRTIDNNGISLAVGAAAVTSTLALLATVAPTPRHRCRRH